MTKTTPTLEPPLHAFTTTGAFIPCASKDVSSPFLIHTLLAVGTPFAIKICFVTALSIPIADASAPEPVYLIPCKSNVA